jgi:ankyrin repeat protein
LFVEERLRTKAEGTFLWVALACGELLQPKVVSMNTEKFLSKLPSGLFPLYGRIWEQVLSLEDNEMVMYIISIFRAMVVAQRPLTLRELAIAANLPKEHHHNTHMLEEYVNQCGSMVTVRQDTAYFVHQSAKSYILLKGRDRFLSPDLHDEHTIMAANCFQYIVDGFLDTIDEGYKRRKSAGEQGNNIDYPIVFWTDHARLASKTIIDSIDVNGDFFGPSPRLRQAWFDVYWEKTHTKGENKPSGFTSIHVASYAGLTLLLSRLLETGHLPELHVIDSLGNQPLLWAARNGHEGVARLLLQKGADVEARNHDGVTALHLAAANGHVSTAQLLLDHGMPITVQDKRGRTPLHATANHGHVNVASLLLDRAVDVDVKDGCSWTPLHNASRTGNESVVKLLLNRNASVKIRDREGLTALQHAAWNGHASCVLLLLRKGANIESRALDGWTPLQSAAWNGHEECVKILLQEKANINARNNAGSTALHHVSWKGFVGLAELLVKEGADVNCDDSEGGTALQQAAWRGHAEVVSALIQSGSGLNVNARNKSGQTALHQAAGNGQEEIVRLLVNAGVDHTLQDNDGGTAQRHAQENNHTLVVKILMGVESSRPSTAGGTRTPVDQMPLDPAVANILSLDPRDAQNQLHGHAGFSTPSKITAIVNGQTKQFFMKSGQDPEMFKSISTKNISPRKELTSL